MFSSLVGLLSSFSLPFSGFLFCFYFAASSSRSLSLPPSPLSSCSFLTFPSSALFSLLSSAFLFLSLLLFPSFPSPSSSFSYPFWFLLLSPLAPLSQLSLPFLLLLPFRLFLFCPSPLFFSLHLLPPFLFLYPLLPFMRAILPSHLSSLPLCSVPLLPLCLLSLWLSVSLSLRFWVVLVFSVFLVWVFSVPGFSFRPCVSFFSPHFLLAPSCAFASVFSALPYLPSSVPLLSIVLLLGTFLSPLLLCLSLRLLLPRLRSPSLIPLFGGGGGGGLRRSDYATYTIVGGLCCSSGVFSMVSTPSSLYLLLSLLALLLCLRLLLCWLPLPLLWVCGSRVGLCSGGFSWVSLASGSSAFLPSLFSASGPPLLSCALFVSSMLCCFYLSSWPLRGSVPCF